MIKPNRRQASGLTALLFTGALAGCSYNVHLKPNTYHDMNGDGVLDPIFTEWRNPLTDRVFWVDGASQK